MDSFSTVEVIQSWLVRLKEGDENARNEIIRYAQNRLIRLTRRMLRSYPGVRRWEETHDVYQNVYLRLNTTFNQVSIRTPKDFFSLAAMHIRWELGELARKHSGRNGLNSNMAITPEHGKEAAMNGAADHSADPYKLAIWCEFHAHVSALPEDERQLFDLIFYQGLTQQEAADVLNMPLRTLKHHWQQVRVRLMERLGNFPF